MTRTATPDTYTEARDHLAELEAEAAGIDAAIARATHAGDEGALPRLWARKAVLPSAIEQARDTVAPLDLAHTEAAIAGLDAALTNLTERIAGLTEQIRELEAERGRLTSEVQEHQQRRRDLDHIRRRAWRRVQTAEATEQ